MAWVKRFSPDIILMACKSEMLDVRHQCHEKFRKKLGAQFD